MANCKYCGTDCPEQGEHDRFFECGLYTERKPTNGDRIRAMSDEELARERIEFNYNPNGADYYSGDFGSVDVVYNAGMEQPESYAEALRLELDWLRQPAEEG